MFKFAFEIVIQLIDTRFQNLVHGDSNREKHLMHHLEEVKSYNNDMYSSNTNSNFY